jgi:hypothetical protein
VIEATVNTTVSTPAVWLIVIVASLSLGFWLTMIFVADRSQVRASGPRRTALGTWAGGSVAGGRADEFPGEAVHQPTRTPGSYQQGAGEAPNVPAQAEPTAMPRQRSGEADRAARSYAGPDDPEDEETR